MSILVLGSNSQIGKDLLEITDEVDSFQFLSRTDVNISNRRYLKSYINNSELVINFAAFTNVEESEEQRFSCLRSNFLGPKNIASLCDEKKIPLIHISTDYVFDGKKNSSYTEEDLVNPLNFYGKTKLLGEEEIRKVLKRHIIIRTSWVFGRQNKNFLKTIIRMLFEKDEIQVVSDQVGGPTSSRYLAEKIQEIAFRCLDRNFCAWGTYNLSGYPHCSWYEFANEIKKVCLNRGVLLRNKQISPISSSKAIYKAKRPLNSKLDTRKIKSYFEISDDDWRKSLILDIESKQILNIMGEYER